MARPRWRSRWYHPHASRECQTGWRPVPHLSARLRAGRAAPRCARAGCHRSGACALGQQGALLTGEASAGDQASRQLYWAVRASARGDNHGGAPAVLVVVRCQKISHIAVLQQLHVRDDVQAEKLSGAGDTEEPVRWPCGPVGLPAGKRGLPSGCACPPVRPAPGALLVSTAATAAGGLDRGHCSNTSGARHSSSLVEESRPQRAAPPRRWCWRAGTVSPQKAATTSGTASSALAFLPSHLRRNTFLAAASAHVGAQFVQPVAQG